MGDSRGEIESHESFIKIIMEEEKERISQLGKPALIENTIDSQSQ